jgi:hypothetical protein
MALHGIRTLPLESKLWKASVVVVTATLGAGILLEITMKKIQ